MEPITIVCWLWGKENAWRPGTYSPKHVKALENMLWKHMTAPYRFVCVTDYPEEDFDCETVPITWSSPVTEENRRAPNCYKRLFMFSDEAKAIFGPKILSIDLDCIILDDLAPLITDDKFKAVRGGCSTYNGSMWQLKTGSFPTVWSNLNEKTMLQARRLKIEKEGGSLVRMYGSDQVWMSYKLGPNWSTWSDEDGVYQFSNCRQVIPDNAKIMFFAGQVKPWGCRYRDIYEQYV